MTTLHRGALGSFFLTLRLRRPHFLRYTVAACSHVLLHRSILTVLKLTETVDASMTSRSLCTVSFVSSSV